MHGRFFRTMGLGSLVSLFPLAPPPSAPAAQPAESQPAVAYVAGVEALEAADFKRAAELLGRAVAADGDNADYLRALGVAHTLAEDFYAAVTDLQRALRLRGDDREARLWLAAAFLMGGDPASGSQHFSVSGVPPDYADMVYNRMAMDYWSSRTHGTYLDRETRRQVQVREPVRTLFPEAARAYARRHKATGAPANRLVVDRMKTAMARGDWAASLNDLEVLRRTEPDDAALRGDMARCLLGAGDALHAREEFTRALCMLPLWAEGYVGRAQAAAVLGDTRRMAADLEAAAELGAKTGDAKAAVQRLAAPRPDDAAVERFAQAAKSGADDASLIRAALAAHRRFNAVRERYDESYQDRVWAISDAIRAEPKDAGRHEMLGRFLCDHHVVPSIWNGPRATTQLRPQSPAERAGELRRAIEAADAALKIDGRHANALATKGWTLRVLGGAGQEGLADQCLASEPRNLRGLTLKTAIVSDRAAQFEAAAAGLRSGRTETTREQRSDGVYLVTRHYPPTAQDLAEAARLDEKAAVCREQIRKLEAETARVRTQVVPALVADGKQALGSALLGGSRARRAFEEAQRCDPDHVDVLKGLAEVCRREGDVRMQRAYALLTEPFRHTSAAEPLKSAWAACVRTAWNQAESELERAEREDPVDARIAAYRAVVAGARGDAAAAANQRRAALALEEARSRLMGVSFAAPGPVPLRVDEVALTVALRLQFGNACAAAGRPEDALRVFSVNLANEKWIGGEDRLLLAPTAILPDPQQDPGAVPESPSIASMMAWSRLGAARALIPLGKPAEAQREFRAIRAALANWPATASHRETMNVVDSWARLGIAEAAVAAKDYDGAFQLLMSGEGWPWGLPRDLEMRRKALAEEVRRVREKASEDEVNAMMRMSPDQQRARRAADDLAQLQRQRDGIAAELNNPNLPAGDRRALEGSLAELDRQILIRKGGAQGTRRRP